MPFGEFLPYGFFSPENIDMVYLRACLVRRKWEENVEVGNEKENVRNR